MSQEEARTVSVRKGEPVDRALKRLKSKLDSEGVLEEMRRLRAFECPAERKRRKARTASKRHRIRWRFNEPNKADGAPEIVEDLIRS